MDKRSDDIRQDIESTRASLDEKIDLLQNKATEVVDQTRQMFDVKTQVSQKPWVALGLALAAGYAAGMIGNDKKKSVSSGSSHSFSQDYNQHAAGGSPTMDSLKSKGQDFFSMFDEEIDMLKVAAVTTLTSFIRDAAREAVPALAPQIDKLLNERGMGGSTSSGFSSGGSGSYSGGSGGGFSSGSSFGDSGSYSGGSGGSSSSDMGSSVSAGASSGTSYSGEHGSFTRSTAPNNSMDVDANEGRINHDAIPAEMNRYGNPPPTPTRDEEDYYTTYQPDEDSREVGGNDRTRY